MKPSHNVSVALEEPRLPESAKDAVLVAPARVAHRTIAMHLPLLHNPNGLGIRMPIGFGKFRQTFRELKSQFCGFNVSLGFGWCTEDGIWDPFLRIDFDAEVTPDLEGFLTWWREVLRDRFRQRSFHMTLSGPLRWIS